MQDYKVKKKELIQDFFILILCLTLVISSLTNVIAYIINDDVKFLKEKIIKMEKDIIDLKSNKTQ
jgi:hypothetical protein